MKYLLLSLTCFIFACSSPDVRDDTLRIALECDVRSLDPRVGEDHTSTQVVRMLYDGLYRYALDGSLIPAVAENAIPSKDRKSFVINLKKTLWANGDPLLATHFVEAWRRAVTPATAATSTHNFYIIKNAEAITKGELPPSELGARAIAPYVIHVELEHPAPYFLDLLATTVFSPLHPEDPTLSNGPFKLKEWKRSERVLVEKNPNYWDDAHVYLKTIQVDILPSDMTQLLLFEQGKLDWVGRPLSRLPVDALPSLRETKGVSYYPILGAQWYLFNTERPPFTNAKVRRAFSMAIHRQKITDYVIDDSGTPALGLIPKAIALQQAPYFADGFTIDANALLDEGLSELGMERKDLSKLTLAYANLETNQKVAEAIQDQWRKAFGVEIKLRNVEWNVHFQNMNQRQFDIASVSWCAPYPDPSYFLSLFRNKSDSINFTGWENAEYKALLDKANRQKRLDQRKHFLHKAEKIFMEEMPLAPLYFAKGGYMKSPRLHDVFISNLNEIDFKYAFFENLD